MSEPNQNLPDKNNNSLRPQGYSVNLPSKPAKVAYKYAKSYFPETQKIIAEIEESIPGKLMVYYVPEKYSIINDHADHFIEALKDVGETEKINLLIYSSGGDWVASLRMVNIIRNYCKEFNVVVPSRCASAATKIALGADKIFFTPSGFLTPVDTQMAFKMNQDNNIGLTGELTSCDSINKTKDLLLGGDMPNENKDRVLKGYEILFKYLHPSLVGEVMRVSKASERSGLQMMKTHPQSFESDEKIREIARRLVYDYPSHTYPIMYSEAKEIGLPTELIEDKSLCFKFWELLKFYRSATREVVTSLSASQKHVEENSIIIETGRKRIVRRFSFDSQYHQAAGKWQYINDNSQWVKVVHFDNQFGYKTIPIHAEEDEVMKDIAKNQESADTLVPPKS